MSGVKSPVRREEETYRRGSVKETSNQSSSSEATTNPCVEELVQDECYFLHPAAFRGGINP